MFTATKADLSAALGLAMQVVERRNTIPILGNLLLSRKGGMLQITACNLDMEMAVTAKVEFADSFEPITCPAMLLKDIVSKMPSAGRITFSLTGAGLVIECGRSRFVLQTLPAIDFPEFGTGDAGSAFTLDTAAFVAAIRGVEFAMSTEETRYYLNGFLLEHEAERLVLVATDGHRLSRRVVAAAGIAPFERIIVPRTAVKAILNLLDSCEHIHIAVEERRICFTADDASLTCKLIDGNFPEYQRVIPANNENLATMDRAGLQAAAYRVSAISSERGRATRLSFASGELTLSINDPDNGSAIEKMDIDYADAVIDIGFNGRYLAEALGHIHSDTVTMSLGTPGGPAILRAEGSGDELIVLMPMRF